MAKLEDCYHAGWDISFNTSLKKWIGVKNKGKVNEFVCYGDHQSDLFKEIVKHEKWPEPSEKQEKVLEESVTTVL